MIVQIWDNSRPCNSCIAVFVFVYVVVLPKAELKREYLVIRDNFCQFCTKTFVTPHLNCLNETVQMRGSQHTVSVRNKKNYPSIIIKYCSYLELC